jgi:hypothetical protein
LARVTARCLCARLRGCALSPIALFVFTPPLCLLALLFTTALVALARLLCLLTLTLTAPLVVVVAVRACGSPAFADVVPDLPEVVTRTHLWLLT